MWMFVSFDLPTKEIEERRASASFRKDLLDLGFTMFQYSIYYKFCRNSDVASSLNKKICLMSPQNGSISIFGMTDKQMENTINIINGEYASLEKKPEKYRVF